MIKRGFTLIEVLVAGGILFLVSASVVGLSNSIIQGTQVSTDRTVMNLWAQEGLEIVKKQRDDNALSRATWLKQAEDSSVSNYGFYKLIGNTLDTSRLSTPLSLELARVETQSVENLKANEITAYRVICLEAVGARLPDNPAKDTIYCNTDNVGASIDDGSRSNVAVCGTGDKYCTMTQGMVGKVIPAGNAIKVRSIVFWYDQDGRVQYTDMATMLTNWQWSGNAI